MATPIQGPAPPGGDPPEHPFRSSVPHDKPVTAGDGLKTCGYCRKKKSRSEFRGKFGRVTANCRECLEEIYARRNARRYVLQPAVQYDMYPSGSHSLLGSCIKIPVGSSVDTDGFLIAPKGNEHVNNNGHYETTNISDDGTAGHENPHTGAEQEEAEDDIETLVCSNYERVGHRVSKCINADQNGWVWGCGICNSESHITEWCPSLATLSPDQKWKELFHVFVTLRAGLPPLVAQYWDWCLEAAKDDAPELAQYPFTPEQSRQWWIKNPDLWRSYDYWEAPDLGVEPEVTSKAQLRGERNFSCKYNSGRERKER